ncbi:MAG: hypothetical protein A3I83_01615 [Methylotenera sp. RIFCSPLOWO2_02_FULL_45_14]|nr:MAG: hypothetical protein A3I83_01615 [Methylotenera sp. RIFCSPLOWO2_02_FULL_45_14]
MDMWRINFPPHQVFIHTRPVQTEGESEQQFLQRGAKQQDAADVRQIPYLLGIVGRRHFQSEEENKIVDEEQYSTDPGFGFKVWSAKDGANCHSSNGGIDRVPRQKIEQQESDEWRSECLVMVAVQRQTFFCLGYGNIITMSENGIEHGSDAADAETENQAFQIEAGALRQIKKGWWVPVLGHEQRFGEAERGGGQTDRPHRLPVMWKGIKDDRPWDQECRGPCKPDVI